MGVHLKKGSIEPLLGKKPFFGTFRGGGGGSAELTPGAGGGGGQSYLLSNSVIPNCHRERTCTPMALVIKLKR